MNKINWQDIPWKKVYGEVADIQESIVMAYKVKNYKLVYQLQRKLVVSFAARALAVRKVTTNSGSKPVGVDKLAWDTPSKRCDAIDLLREITHSPKRYRAQPVHRVWIPKANTKELSSLSIPTLTDRAVQALYVMAIDPIVEAQSDPHSYGFRRYKSAHDAIVRLRFLLDKKTSPAWILNADVEKCFEKISHEFFLQNTMICDKTVLEQWLRCGVVELGMYKDTYKGTPLGGLISPMLRNLALNGLEETAQKAAFKPKKGTRNKIHLTRYANDFACTAVTETMLETQVKEGISRFLDERGLAFQDMKTRIAHIDEGFDFLGFTFQKKAHNYKFNHTTKLNPVLVNDDVLDMPLREKEKCFYYTQGLDTQKHESTCTPKQSLGKRGVALEGKAKVLIIKPTSTRVQELRNEIKRVVVSKRNIESIIRDVNPKIREWGEYFCISHHSLPSFWLLGHYVWSKMWKWARKRHPQQRAKWIRENYTMANTTRKWVFGKTPKQVVYDISRVTAIKLFPLKQGLNPYLQENREYLEKRRQAYTGGGFRAAVYRKHKHTCPHCEQSLYNGEPVELHHIIAQKAGGEWKLDNIQPLHQICHQSVTHGKGGEQANTVHRKTILKSNANVKT